MTGEGGPAALLAHRMTIMRHRGQPWNRRYVYLRTTITPLDLTDEGVGDVVNEKRPRSDSEHAGSDGAEGAEGAAQWEEDKHENGKRHKE